MPRLPLSDIDGNVYERLMGHRPEILAKWFELDALIRFSPTLDPALKEEVRRAMAPGIGCVFCSTLGPASPEHADPKVALAVAFAERVVEDRASIDDDAFAVLAEEFTTEQVTELICWISFIFGAQLFGALMSTTPATADEVEVYAEWRRTGTEAAAQA